MANQRFGLITGLLLLGVLIVVGAVAWFPDNDKIAPVELAEKEDPKPEEKPVKTQSLSEALGLSEEDMTVVGKVKRPKRDVEFQKVEPGEDTKVNPLPHPGLAPTVKWNENEQVAGLIKEIAVKNPNPQAASVFFGADKFDREAYLNDPKDYNNKIRPGRVFQSAQPGKGVVPIEAAGPTFKSVLQGEKVVLRAKAEPGMPVTFHTNQLGEFENRLKTITVSANEEGVAVATYLAGPGTMGLINILAASPVHSEDIEFMVDVSLP